MAFCPDLYRTDAEYYVVRMQAAIVDDQRFMVEDYPMNTSTNIKMPVNHV